VRGHADAETLAAFRAELLSRRKAARVSAHLAACPRCAALDAQLAGVTALLRRTTAPPIPDALTARIEAALAAEAAARPATTGAVPAAAPGIATQGTGRRDGARGTAGRRAARPGRDRSRLALRVAAVTAAVAVVAGGGYGVSRLLSGNPPSATGSASSGAAGGGGAAPAVRPNGAVPRMSGGGMQSPVPGTFGRARKSTVLARVVTSGTNYQPARLAAQAATVLAEFGLHAPGSASPAPTVAAPRTGPASLFPDLQACVVHVAAGQHALLADVAQYQGHPALIVVLPAVHGGRPRALVIAPGCTATTAQVLAAATLPGSG
jgi:hypothetical protein